MASTIVHVFSEQVRLLDSQVAMRRRAEHGWEEITWSQYGREVDGVGLGLLALGVEAGDPVGIMSSNRPEWLFCDLGVMSVGAVTVPLYPTLIASGAQHIVRHSEMRVLFVEDEAQRDKIREVRGQVPGLEHVVCIGCAADGPGERSWEDFIKAGAATASAHPGISARAREAVCADALATIVYTSGTTGAPKGAMLSHRNVIFEATQLEQHSNLRAGLETLSFLPLSHVAERLQGEILAVKLGMTVNFARSLETVKEDLAEVRPSVLTCVPRLWEKMYEAINTQVSQAPPRRQRIFRWAVDVGKERFEKWRAGERVGRLLAAQAVAADRLVASKLRQRLGLDRAQVLISGAAPLSPTIQEFFAALGLPIQEAYGQTECAGVSHATPNQRGVKPGRVGPPLCGIDVRIAHDGEILIRGDNVFLGYYKDEATTAEALVDGWLHTGDVGEEDEDRYLRITDRKKDIIVTAGGKNVAPQNIENRLKAFVGVSQVVVLGDRRKYLVALITIDPEAASGALGAGLEGPPSESQPLRDYLERVVDEVNRDLSSYETVKRFEVLDTDFSIEGGELTPTLKVKRRVIDERYRELIDQMYAAA